MKKIIYSIVGLVVMASCSQNPNNAKQKQQENITQIENFVDSVRKTRPVTPDEMYNLINNYWQYYTENPTDSLSPVFLYRAAESSLYINQGLKAISYLKRIETEFPTFKNLSNVLFLIGFTYENNEKSYDAARKYYELFLEKYPDHALANDTKILIKNLGKTPEELIKEFEEANAKKGTN